VIEWLKRRSGRTAIALVVMLLAAGFAVSFPADIAFIMALDLSTWVEAFVVVCVAAQVTKVRPILVLLRARLRSWRRGSQRQSRTRAVGCKKLPPSKDEPVLSLMA
jgi:hypothetical protein